MCLVRTVCPNGWIHRALLAASLAALLAGALARSASANVVVGHDVNTLGSSLAGEHEARFAVNVANLITRGTPGRSLLLFESRHGDGNRNYAPIVLDSLRAAGFTVEVTNDFSRSFASYDAVFAAQAYPTARFLDNDALIAFAHAGRGVYLAGGVSGSSSNEGGGWNHFLNSIGLAYSTSGFNLLNLVTITSTHEIFNGVPELRCGNGQDVIELGTDSAAHVVQFSGAHGVYGVWEPIITSGRRTSWGDLKRRYR